MVLAMWRLRKLREENEQKLELAVKAAREEAREETQKEGRQRPEEERQRWIEWARQVEEDARAAGFSIKEPPPLEDE